MASCNRCGAEIIFVDKGFDQKTGKKRWIPHNPDLSPHVCGQTKNSQTEHGGAPPCQLDPSPGHSPSVPFNSIIDPAKKERRICAMWSISRAIELTNGVPMDLDTRLHLVDEYARKLFALVDLVAEGNQGLSPVPAETPAPTPTEAHA